MHPVIQSLSKIHDVLILRTAVMAGFLSRFCGQIKGWIQWSWTYLWAVWFMLVVFVIYILRGPLKLSENVSYGMHFIESGLSIRSKHYPTHLVYVELNLACVIDCMLIRLLLMTFILF